jgi:putative flippase GtrA
MTPVAPKTSPGLTARLSTLREQPIVQKFTRYFLVGGICALIDLALFWAFWQASGLRYGAFAFAFVFSTGTNYYLSVRYVFERAGRSREQAVFLVYVASAVGVAINLAVFSTLMELFGIHPVLAKVAGIGVGFGWNFASRYFWVFRPAK